MNVYCHSRVVCVVLLGSIIFFVNENCDIWSKGCMQPLRRAHGLAPFTSLLALRF